MLIVEEINGQCAHGQITQGEPMDKNVCLLTQKQVAELIGMSEAWLEQCRFRRTGINYIKVGRSVRYRYVDVQAWLEAQTTICD